MPKLLNAILERGRYTTTEDLEIQDVSVILTSLEDKGYVVPFNKAIIGYIANINHFLGEEHDHLVVENE